jgi:hypothetical protein
MCLGFGEKTGEKNSVWIYRVCLPLSTRLGADDLLNNVQCAPTASQVWFYQIVYTFIPMILVFKRQHLQINNYINNIKRNHWYLVAIPASGSKFIICIVNTNLIMHISTSMMHLIAFRHYSAHKLRHSVECTTGMLKFTIEWNRVCLTGNVHV